MLPNQYGQVVKMDGKLKKGDLILILTAVLVSGIALWFFKSTNAGEKVLITANGETLEYSLFEDREIKLAKGKKYSNLIQIKDGKVKMLEADCPDQVCVNHRAIEKDREMIICLPNEVFIQIKGGEEKDVDN